MTTEVPTIDPDAPWWANLLLLAIVALVPTIFAVRAKQEAKRSVDTAETAHAETTEKMDRVLHNVENSHKLGLRDDLDQKVGDLDAKVERALNLIVKVAEDVREANAEVRGARIDVTHMHSDLGGVRTDIRAHRSRLNLHDRMFTDLVDQAQSIIDNTHPGPVPPILRMPSEPTEE